MLVTDEQRRWWFANPLPVTASKTAAANGRAYGRAYGQSRVRRC